VNRGLAALILNLGYSWISGPGRLNPWERSRGAHWTGGWVGLGVGLDALEKKKNLCVAGNRSCLS